MGNFWTSNTGTSLEFQDWQQRQMHQGQWQQQQWQQLYNYNPYDAGIWRSNGGQTERGTNYRDHRATCKTNLQWLDDRIAEISVRL